MKTPDNITTQILSLFYSQLIFEDDKNTINIFWENDKIDDPLETSFFYKNYNDSIHEDRIELLEKIDNFFPVLDQKQRYRIWEMSRAFLEEHDREPLINSYDQIILQETITHYSLNTFYKDDFLYPSKYWNDLEEGFVYWTPEFN